MSARDEVQYILINPSADVNGDMTKIDVIIHELIGQDDTPTSEFPKNWNEALKKQYINFRNHLRRSMRSKWGKKEEA